MNAIAVIGAAGKVGSEVLSRLREEGLDVRGVCRSEVTAGPLRIAGFDVRCGDLATDARRLVGDCDVVINCASASGLAGSARLEDKTNLLALLALPQARRILHFSSVAVYSTCIIDGRNTFARPRPEQSYGRSKLWLERFALRHVAARHELFVLRLGHVYGPGQWVSRFVFDSLRDPSFGLPFDGALPSNAVHVRNVAAATLSLVRGPAARGTFNLFDTPRSTWRRVFDSHTSALGAPPARSLDNESSERSRTHHRRIAATPHPIQIARDTGRWARTLPISLLRASPSLWEVGLSVLGVLQSRSLEDRALQYFAAASVPAQRAQLVEKPWLVCDGAPGPDVAYGSELTAADARALAAWHTAYSSPDALVTFPSTPAHRFAEA
jgi:nucleoside-diphosphate-sugar epimerase